MLPLLVTLDPLLGTLARLFASEDAAREVAGADMVHQETSAAAIRQRPCSFMKVVVISSVLAQANVLPLERRELRPLASVRQ